MTSRCEDINRKIADQKKQLNPKRWNMVRSLDECKRCRGQGSRQRLKAKLEQLQRKAMTLSAWLGQETQERLQRGLRGLDALPNDIMLRSGFYDDTGRIKGLLTNLSVDLEHVRSKGRASGNFMKSNITVLSDKWEEMTGQVDGEIEKPSNSLERQANQAERSSRQAFRYV